MPTPSNHPDSRSGAPAQSTRSASTRSDSIHLLDLPQTRWAFAALTLGLALFICWQAFVSSGVDLAFYQSDKLLHILAFSTLTVSARLGSSKGAALGWLACAGLLAFGGFIEVVQSFIPSRDASWLDLLADAVGIALGRGLGNPVLRVLKKII